MWWIRQQKEKGGLAVGGWGKLKKGVGRQYGRGTHKIGGSGPSSNYVTLIANLHVIIKSEGYT